MGAEKKTFYRERHIRKVDRVRRKKRELNTYIWKVYAVKRG